MSARQNPDFVLGKKNRVQLLFLYFNGSLCNSIILLVCVFLFCLDCCSRGLLCVNVMLAVLLAAGFEFSVMTDQVLRVYVEHQHKVVR